MKQIQKYPVLFLTWSLLLTGCLTVEKKEYSFKLMDKNSGTLTIKFINIMSMKDDTADISNSDFEELISDYIEGNEIEKDFGQAMVRSKRLFTENGQLCGEVVINFENLQDVGLYRYKDRGPYMFNISSFLEGETFLQSNGDFGGSIMPVVFWPEDEKLLQLTTFINAPDESMVSLAENFEQWKKTGE